MNIGASEIRGWHKKRGWKDIGYHYVIRLDGTVELGRPLKEIGSHVQGQNSGSVGICYVGGLGENRKALDTLNEAQEKSLTFLVQNLRSKLGKDLKVYGHNDFTKAKACPSFKVSERLKHLAV